LIWNDRVLEDIRARMNIPGNTYASVADDLSADVGERIHPEQLRGALRRYISRRNNIALAPVEKYGFVQLDEPFLGLMVEDVALEFEPRFPEPSRISEEKVLTIEDTNVLIVGDIHAPFHSPEMLERAVCITHKYFPHIRTVAVIGDLFDFAAISNHVNNQPVTSTEEDMRAGGKIARSLRAAFDHMYIGPGNHDERISKKLNSQFSMESLLCGAFGNTDPGLHITDLDYFYIGDEIIAGHPSMYSTRTTGVAQKVALMQRKNTITGHSHKVGITVSEDGVHWTIDNGHCANSELFYYVRRRMSTFGKMGAGFTIISNGMPFVYGDAITDWGFWK
jgi:hypothetical protein